jgi:hypothetical protein
MSLLSVFGKFPNLTKTMLFLFHNRIRKVCALVAATLILLPLGYAQENSPTATPETRINSLQTAVASLQNQVNSLQTSNTTLQREVTALQHELTTARSVLALAPYVSVDPNTEIGVIGPNIVFSGANIHIVSGSGATDDNLSKGESLTGLGNLIIGYNEDPADPTLRFGGTRLGPGERGGSHNLVIGRGHRFTKAAFGGLVVGEVNRINNSEATVLGGGNNTASGVAASVLGGTSNTASGIAASVLGGIDNSADTDFAHFP